MSVHEPKENVASGGPTRTCGASPHSNRPRGWRMALLVGIVVALGLAGCTGSQAGVAAGDTPSGVSEDGTDPDDTGADAALDPVRVAYVPIGTLLPAFVALDEGIFERNGIDVTLTPNENVTTIPGTLGRQFDIGASTSPDIIKAVGQGIDVGTITGGTADTEDNPVGQIVVPGDSEIQDVTDLSGRRVATPSSGAAMHVSLLHWLSTEGVDPSSVTTVEAPFPTMGDQLAAGRVDAVEAVQPFLGLLLDAGNRSIGSPLLSVGEPPVLGVIWIADRDWATNNPTTVERWTRSLVEAEAFIDSNETRAREILQEYTALPPGIAEAVQLPDFAASMSAEDLQSGLEAWIPALENAGQFSGEVSGDLLVVPGGGAGS